jgi:hypothetical protein
MKMLMSLGLSAALAAAAGVATSAQSSPPQPPPPADKDQVTVTGCLERAPASNDSVIGTSGTEPGPIFVLVKPAERASGTEGASGTTGTTGTTAARSNIVYRLQTANVSELVAHEGAKVEIKGTAVDAGGGDQSSGPGKPGRAPTLKLSSLKSISSDCAR